VTNHGLKEAFLKMKIYYILCIKDLLFNEYVIKISTRHKKYDLLEKVSGRGV
jgi:hypothetical protein